MSYYVQKSCPICGGPVKFDTAGQEICENCGYTLPSNISVTKTNITDNCKQEHCSFPECNHTCGYTGEENVGGLYGWICPKCGAVMSPFTTCCPNCTKRNFEITCNTGGSNL